LQLTHRGVQKEDYDASKPKKHNGADDSVKEVPNPAEIPKLNDVMETGKPDVAEKPKRKHGHPIKIKNDDPNEATNTLKEQFATENIATLVEEKHKRFP
jgi:hypothetical protein